MLFKCLSCGTEVVRSEKYKKFRVFCSRSCAAKSNRNRLGTGKVENASKTNTCPGCGGPCYNKYCTPGCQQAVTWKLKMESIVKSNGAGVSDGALKRYLLNTQPRICQICKRDEHIGLPIPLVMDHINGNPYDGSLSNIRLICPNCDSQLPTWGNRNRGNGRKLKAEQLGIAAKR